MFAISLNAVIALTDQSERTLRRRIADGSLPRVAEEGGSSYKTLIPFEAIRPQLVVPLDSEDIQLVKQADSGSASAQNDLALLLLSHRKPQGALYWLELAAKQECPEAMHWLARCYLEGNGVTRDENIGLMWLARSAARGHLISQEQVQAMRECFIRHH
ncbi:sel1 repeat family protein [Noviherbaspirillum sp. CPCC 100848]|uniref:Sel1 repeat family protein n=1 Tax=Noviherbaspirillum album TaxID=3080276 RepID=A0ABU6JHC2_9BURK|nr:sel1 repeat family protein [Noviherbaspirillum sp. CPCC 100848]MEC4723047.1 sel1 repeat family protein [Noviherbaspirillum sp. CPCC 100848]